MVQVINVPYAKHKSCTMPYDAISVTNVKLSFRHEWTRTSCRTTRQNVDTWTSKSEAGILQGRVSIEVALQYIVPLEIKGETGVIVVHSCKSNYWAHVFKGNTTSLDFYFSFLQISVFKMVNSWWWWWIGCFTSQLMIFQSYMWRHIDVQADWRRSWTYGRAPNAIDIS